MPTYLAYENGLEVLWGIVGREPARARGARAVAEAGCGAEGRKLEVGFVVACVPETTEGGAEDAS